VISLIAQGLDQEKYELHLGVVTRAENCAESLPPWVYVHFLEAHRVRAGALRMVKLVRRLKPDLILSGMFHLSFLVLLLRPLFPRKTRILVRQNGTVSASLAFGGLPWYTRLFYNALYRNADHIICQTQSMASDLSLELGIQQSQLAVLPNPVNVDEIRNSIGVNSASRISNEPHLLAVGRLSREKGFDLLLRALVVVRRQLPNATLSIVGTGPEESSLRAECHTLRLDEAVNFAGQVAQPWKCFSDATLFVLPSRHEGMPNALLEAAAGGLPIVALPTSGGVVELLRKQPGVWVADEVSAEALAASLLSALGSLRQGERFAHPFVEEFRMDRAIKAYEALIDRSLEEKVR
jgi:glycosyltransferase involved in cell wall biosynthesis